MSRHKLVRTLNLDDELDDYDGGAKYGQVEDAGDEQGECYKVHLDQAISNLSNFLN